VGNEKEGHVYRGITYSTTDIQRRYISIVVSDLLEKTIDTILEAASTGNGGMEKIFVSDIQETYRIRTKEKGGCHQITNLNKKITNKKYMDTNAVLDLMWVLICGI
jgi:nitrogen regulatory protein PII